MTLMGDGWGRCLNPESCGLVSFTPLNFTTSSLALSHSLSPTRSFASLYLAWLGKAVNSPPPDWLLDWLSRSVPQEYTHARACTHTHAPCNPTPSIKAQMHVCTAFAICYWLSHWRSIRNAVAQLVKWEERQARVKCTDMCIHARTCVCCQCYRRGRAKLHAHAIRRHARG